MEKQNYNCSDCDKVFTDKWSMTRHRLNCKEKSVRFSCVCGKTFSRKDSLNRHKRVCKHASSNREVNQVNNQGGNQKLAQHDKQDTNNNTANKLEENETPIVVVPEIQDADMITQDVFNDSFEEYLTPQFMDYVDNHITADNWYCSFCKLIVSAKDKLKHFRSNEHKGKAQIKQDDDDDTYLVSSCFDDKIVVYRITNKDETNLSLSTFLMEKKTNIINLLKSYVKIHSMISYQIEVTTTFTKPDLEGGTVEGKFYINHSYAKLSVSDLRNESIQTGKIEEIFQQLCRNSEEIVMKGSNWTLSKIHHLDLHINKKESLIGGALIELPPSIAAKKACLNPQNRDNQCFKWCVLAFFLNEILKGDVKQMIDQVKQDPTLSDGLKSSRIIVEYHKLSRRLSNISAQDEAMVNSTFDVSFENVEFPTKLEDLDNFAANNPDINLNVFGISAEDEKTIVGPLYSSERDARFDICLLFLTKGTESHYCLIKDLSRLAARQRKNRRVRQFYCQVCLLAFNSEEQLKAHKEAGCLGKFKKQS